MTNPDNNPASISSAPPPLPSQAHGPSPILGYAAPLAYADSRTRGWLITAGVLWSLLFIPLIITSAIAMGAVLVSGFKNMSPDSEMTNLAITAGVAIPFSVIVLKLAIGTFRKQRWVATAGVAIPFSVIVLKLAIGTFRKQRWVATAGPVMAIVLMIIAMVYNPIFAYLDHNNYIISTSGGRWGWTSSRFNPDMFPIMIVQSLLMALAGLLCFIHLRLVTTRDFALHALRPHWVDKFSIWHLLLVVLAGLTVLGDVIVWLNPLSFPKPYYVNFLNDWLPTLSISLGLGLLILNLRSSRWNWPVALALYGLWIYRLGYASLGRATAPISYYPSLILLAFVLAAMHLWLRPHSNTAASDESSLGMAPPPRPVQPTPASPFIAPQMATMSAPAQAFRSDALSAQPPTLPSVQTLSYASLPVNSSRLVQRKVIFSSILWAIVAFNYAATYYSEKQEHLEYLKSLAMYSDRTFEHSILLQMTPGNPNYLPQVMLSLFSMLLTASIAVGLLQKKRWSAPLAAAIAPILLILFTVLPTTEIYRVFSKFSLTINLVNLVILTGPALLMMILVAFLVRLHLKCDIAQYFREHNSKSSLLDDHPQGHLLLICWFLAMAGMEIYFCFTNDAPLPTMLQDLGEYAIAIRSGFAVLSIVTAYLIFRKTVVGWILGFAVCGLGLWQAVNIAIVPESISTGWGGTKNTGMGLGLGIAIMIFCGLILFGLIRTMGSVRTPVASN